MANRISRLTLLRWKRQWGGADRIVWVIVRKFDELWECDGDYYLSPHNASYKYQRFGEWLAANASIVKVDMPHVSLNEGIATFTDGRHRFAWCRDHGVRALPVTVSGKLQSAELTRLVGSRIRRCVVPSVVFNDQ
jgi:hypothetical protein